MMKSPLRFGTKLDTNEEKESSFQRSLQPARTPDKPLSFEGHLYQVLALLCRFVHSTAEVYANPAERISNLGWLETFKGAPRTAESTALCRAQEISCVDSLVLVSHRVGFLGVGVLSQRRGNFSDIDAS